MIKFTTTPDQNRIAAEVAANIKGVQVQKTQIKFLPVHGATETTVSNALHAMLTGVETAKAQVTDQRNTVAHSSLIRKITAAIESLPKMPTPKAAPVVAPKTSAKEKARTAAAKPKVKAAAKKAKPVVKTIPAGDGPVGGHSIPRQRGTGSIWVRNTGKRKFLTAISVEGKRQRQLFASQAEAEAWLDSMITVAA